MRFTVMTFNVRGSFHEDGVNDWIHRRELNVATLARYAPDIIGFQEGQSGNIEAYQTGLNGYDVELGPLSIRQTEHYDRVPIYWKPDMFEKIDSGGYYLSETPEEWSASWGSTFVWAVTWVRLLALASNSELVVLNTHFPHEYESDTVRNESARLVVQRMTQIAAPQSPIVVMADFNALPGSEVYHIFMNAGYEDTYTAPEDINTYHGFAGGSFSGIGVRIDWILTRDGARSFTTRRCSVVTDDSQPLYPSDHYPVLAELELA